MIASKKILLPLASLLAAGAIAVGSGATFSSTSANSLSSVTSGTLAQTNSKANAATFTLANMKPGDTVNGGLVIKNTGSLAASFGLTETVSTNGFSGKLLSLDITNTTTGVKVFSGNFGDLVDGTRTDLGTVAAGASNSYQFTAKLDAAATNADQNKTASASYSWDSVQAAGETINQ